ncbi:hypothetical protein R0L47_08365 [Pectobacterium polonicum]|uniref:hypothetical protein n=1 Tax=Pectobacterium polonicum TaxID=2485124 RepID=UPI00142EE990|nr:hypothetical protein [Pectobacterium polonicum]
MSELGLKQAFSLTSDVVPSLFLMVREGMDRYEEQARCLWAVFTTAAQRVM